MLRWRLTPTAGFPWCCRRFTTSLLCLVAALLACGRTLGDDRAEFYEQNIRPLLAHHCTTCHGAKVSESGLRLDAGSLILEGGDSGAAVVPGQADASLIIERVRADEGERMPPEGPPLSAEQIAALEEWIAEGAAVPDDEPIPVDPAHHWALLPLQRGDASGVNSIDAILERQREKHGVRAAPAADAETRLKRVYLDLVGLLPSVEELRAFRRDPSPEAYAKIVDRLLASPQHGERWGRHWMDVWRYCDPTLEMEGDLAYTPFSEFHIWHWRDWIIASINENKPYDQMVTEMLAGDELDPDNPSVVAATGFLVRSKNDVNSGRDMWLGEIVEHVSQSLLGMTIKCAQCHDHKYDAISHEDYYRFRAIFEPIGSRIDSLSPDGDTKADGIPRIYDEELSRATYFYATGFPQSKVEDRTLSPGLPEAFPGEKRLEKDYGAPIHSILA